MTQAFDSRDQAVRRKNNCEIELARTRIDLMQVNSQLLEAITQKVELSQQLDQWQVINERATPVTGKKAVIRENISNI